MVDYSYIDKIAKEILSKLITDTSKNLTQEAVLLAAYPGAGKTSAAIQVCSMYLNLYPSAKIKILTHNQNILKNQFLNNLKNPFSEVNFTFGEFGSNSDVEVGLPASRSKIKSNIDLLIVDEAHNYFLKKMDNEIIAKFKPKHTLLLTGTPSVFVRLNNEIKGRFNVVSISGEELTKLDVFSGFGMSNVLCANECPIVKMACMYQKAMEDNFDLSKIMVACKNIKEANIVKTFLTDVCKRKVSLSTSENDTKNLEIDKFVKGENDCLIVVNKGILGFSDNNITSLFDLKRSKDPEARIQLFARILRKHENNVYKNYISYYKDDKDMESDGLIITSCLYLMRKEAYESYDGYFDDSFKEKVTRFFYSYNK